MANGNDIEEKIRKLLALALNNSNESEAAAAMAKARELLLKYEIDEAALHNRKVASDTDVFVINLERTFESWMKLVQEAVSILYDARLIWSKTRSKDGTKYVDVATIVCSAADLPLLQKTYKMAMMDIGMAAGRLMGNKKQNNNFRLGAAHGFLRACADAVQQDTPEMTAIVLVKKDAIDLAVKERFGDNLKTAKRKVDPTDYSAYDKGYAYGRSMSTNKGMKEIEE
jgi:hypothetical protein